MYHFLTKDPYSDNAVYSNLNPLDRGQSLYPMSTVIALSLGRTVKNGFSKSVMCKAKHTSKQYYFWIKIDLKDNQLNNYTSSVSPELLQ